MIEQHCIACHGISRIAKAGGTEAGWADRLKRMIRFGSTLPRQDIPALAVYLAKAYPPRPIPPEVASPEPEPAEKAANPPAYQRALGHRAGHRRAS